MFAGQLDAAVDLTDTELDEAIRAAEIEQRRLHARRAALHAVAEARGVHRADGHHTMTGYLRATINAAAGEIAKLRTIATVCERVPALGDALAAGLVGRCQIEQIARIHTNPRTRAFLPDVAAIYLERAERISHTDLRREIDQFMQFADSDGALADIAAAVEHRSAHVTDVGGAADITARGGDPLTAARLVAIFENFAQREFEHDCDRRRAEHGDDADQHPLPRTAAQRRFDAVTAIFDTAAAAPVDAGPVTDAVTVDVIIDQASLDEVFTRHGLLPELCDPAHDADHAAIDSTLDGIVALAPDDPLGWTERRCHMADGTAIPAELVLRAALTGHIRRVVVDADGTVVDYGRRQRLFTGAARAAAKLLVHRCQHPGCEVPARHADVDHLTEWCDGGRTDQHNAGIACRSHKRYKHRHRWRVAHDAAGHRFHLRSDGTPVVPAGARPPDLTDHETRQVARERLRRLTAARPPTAASGAPAGHR